MPIKQLSMNQLARISVFKWNGWMWRIWRVTYNEFLYSLCLSFKCVRHVWDICGRLCMCGWAAFQTIKVTPVPIFTFEKYSTACIRQPIPIVVYPLFLCWNGGRGIRICLSTRRAVAHRFVNRKLGINEYCGNTEITQEFTHPPKGYEAKRRQSTLQQSVLCRCISSYNVCVDCYILKCLQ